MLALALAFPVALMIFNPTLMFERGWEQYVGTCIYFWAVLTLGRELLRLWRNERAFDDAPALLEQVTAAAAGEASRRRDRRQATTTTADPARARPPARRATPRSDRAVGQPAHGAEPRRLGARPGARRPAGSP